MQFRSLEATLWHSGEYPSLGEFCEQYLHRHCIQYIVLVSPCSITVVVCVISKVHYYMHDFVKFDYRHMFFHRREHIRLSFNIGQITKERTLVTFSTTLNNEYNYFSDALLCFSFFD